MSYLKFLFPLVLLCSCAQIVTPEGGPKDQAPPLLIKSSPPSGSLNIFPKKIVLSFDENIELKNQNENISVTPDLASKPFLKTHKNRIEIYLKKDSLIPNITYSINFGKSIADINEGNILENFNYSFSTGSFLDTAQLHGTAALIKENKPMDKTFVTLKNTKNGLKYSTSTDKNGFWIFKNIAEGTYNLFIFSDINSNKKLENGEVYFKKDITVGDSNPAYETKLIKYSSLLSERIKVNSVKYINDYTVGVVFNKSIGKYESIKYSLNNDLNKKEKPLYPTLLQDSFIIYHPFIEKDSILLTIQTDTLQQFTLVQPIKRTKIPLTFTPYLSVSRKGDPIYIKSSVPLNNINSEKIKINGSNFGFETKLLSPYKISINSYNQSNKEIVFENGAFTDINGVVNNGDTISIKLAEEEQTGNYEFILKDTVTWFKGPVMVKVYNETNEYIIKTELNKSNKLTGLLPGNYSLEAWEDEDNNEKWEQGNYYLNQNPEHIIFLKNFVIIKPNWDTAGVEIYID